MSHVFEPAASGRAKCRACKEPLPKGEVRFGERLPNPFGEGEVTHWYHPRCAAFRRPEALLEALESGEAASPEVADREGLEGIARAFAAVPRLSRIDGAERSPTSQAKCRHCHAPIERGTWRIRLVLNEEGSVMPGGFIHVACGPAYFESDAAAAAVLLFSDALEATERQALAGELASAGKVR